MGTQRHIRLLFYLASIRANGFPGYCGLHRREFWRLGGRDAEGRDDRRVTLEYQTSEVHWRPWLASDRFRGGIFVRLVNRWEIAAIGG